MVLYYWNNIPKRFSGEETYNLTEEYKGATQKSKLCVDERGFINVSFKLSPVIYSFIELFQLDYDASCYFMTFLVSTGSYINNTLYMEKSYSFSGLVSMNRFMNSQLIKYNDSYTNQNNEIVRTYERNIPTYLMLNNDNCIRVNDDHLGQKRCQVYFDVKHYGAICCCYQEKYKCIMRGYKDTNKVCARGSYSATYNNVTEQLDNEVYKLNGQERKTDNNRFQITPAEFRSQFMGEICSVQYRYNATL